MTSKQQKVDAILKKYNGVITGLTDLAGDEPPSPLFFLLANKLSYLLDLDEKTAVSPNGVERRRKLLPIIKALGPSFLNNRQVFENRNFLRNPNTSSIVPDSPIALPEEPVIWISNHGFKDDALGSVLAASRHAYILFGSLPQFFNTIDGVMAWLIGVVMVNRRISKSKKAAIPKAVRAMNCGADLLMYPEGAWNLSPNALILDLWPGVYRIASETGAKVVPIVHYLRDNSTSRDNPIHTVVDDPIRIDDLTERQGISYLRDVMATWYYLMIEAYGKSTRDEALGNLSFVDAWGRHVKERMSFVARWDREMEARADYSLQGKVFPKEVWGAVADIEEITPYNVHQVLYARQLLARWEKEDFQHKF